MKKPRERLDEATRRKQFERAAITLVSEVGYKAVTTDTIAKETGVSKGLLWRYYTNLDELLRDAAKRALGELEKVVAKDLDMALPVPELLRVTIHRAAELPKSHRTELVAIQRIVSNQHLSDGSPAINEVNSYEELYANRSRLFERGKREGQLKSSLDVNLFTRIYQGAVDSMISQLTNDPELDSKAYADCVADIILGGVLA